MSKKLKLFLVAALLAVLCLQVMSYTRINNSSRRTDVFLEGFSQRIEIFGGKQNELVAKLNETADRNDRSMDSLRYMMVLRLDKQADYLFLLSELLKDPSASPEEISAFVKGANVFEQEDILCGAYDIVFDGKVPDYMDQVSLVLDPDEAMLSAMSEAEREQLAELLLQLSLLYDRNQGEDSISWYVFKQNYDDPKLLSLGKAAASLIEQIRTYE